MNHKRVHRLYKEEGLNLRSKRPKRKVSAVNRMEQPALTNKDQYWSMDFVSDQLFNGRKIRALTIVDNFSRECLNIHVDHSVKGEDVVHIMCYIQEELRRKPERIKVDNVLTLESRINLGKIIPLASRCH